MGVLLLTGGSEQVARVLVEVAARNGPGQRSKEAPETIYA